MNAQSKCLELEALEARETPSAGSMAFSGFDHMSLQGMIGLLSAKLGAALNTNLQNMAVLNNANKALAAFEQSTASGTLSSVTLNLRLNADELSQLSNLLGYAVQTVQLAVNGSGGVSLLLNGVPGSITGIKV